MGLPVTDKCTKERWQRTKQIPQKPHKTSDCFRHGLLQGVVVLHTKLRIIIVLLVLIVIMIIIHACIIPYLHKIEQT